MKKRIFTLFIAVIIVVSALAVSVCAYPSATDYVCDEAEMLDESTISQIKATSEALFNTRKTRIAVCTVQSTGNESPKSYATSIYEDWGVGNGVLVLLIKEQNTYYAVQSKSISDVLTAEKLQNLLSTYLEGSFTEGKFAEGTLSTVKALSAFLSSGLPEDFGKEKASGGMPKALKVILIIVIIAVILVIGGYCLLIMLERRQAERRRLYLEEKRRRMAREGRGGSGGYGAPARPYGYTAGSGAPAPMPSAARRPNPQRPNPQRPNPQYPRQNGQRGMNMPQNYRTGGNPYDDYHMQAPTSPVPLDSSEIRRAAQRRDKFAYPDEQQRR